MSNPQNPNPWGNQPPQPGQPGFGGPPPGGPGYGGPPPGQPQWGGPPPGQPGFGGPPPGYGAPPPGQPGFGGPPPGYGQPPQYGAPQAPYGAPQQGFGGQFGQPAFNIAPGAVGQRVGFGPRFLATLIDYIIVGVPTGIIYGILSAIFAPKCGYNSAGFYDCNLSGFGVAQGIGSILGIILFVGYPYLCYNYFNGNTIGKQVMGIKVAMPDGSKPTLTQFMLHFTVGYIINAFICYIGFLWVLFDPYQRTWGQLAFKDQTVTGKW